MEDDAKKTYDGPRDRTGLWKRKSKQGNQMLTGKLQIDQPGEYWINIIPNGYKDKDNQPDYQMFYKPVDSAPVADMGFEAKPAVPAEDDIPF